MTEKADRSHVLVSMLAALLAKHEARWTTHGEVRLYDVLHCAGECDWSLRQTARMTNDYCYVAHRRHVAEVIASEVLSLSPEGGL